MSLALVGELIRKKPLGAACGAVALVLVLVALLADWIARREKMPDGKMTVERWNDICQK